MSVFIPGVETPKNCGGCHFRRSCFDGTSVCFLNPGVYIDFVAFEQHRPEWCPFVEIKTPHGRLVDVREVLEKADKAPWFDGDVSELGLLLGAEVTTIIEAEGGENDG